MKKFMGVMFALLLVSSMSFVFADGQVVEGKDSVSAESSDTFISWYTPKYAQWKELYGKKYPAFIKNLVSLPSLREELVLKHPKTFDTYKKQLLVTVKAIEAHMSAKGTLNKTTRLAVYTAANSKLAADFLKIKALDTAEKTTQQVGKVVGKVKDTVQQTAQGIKDTTSAITQAVGLSSSEQTEPASEVIPEMVETDATPVQVSEDVEAIPLQSEETSVDIDQDVEKAV